jgi:peptide/nickel transport system permease protein
MPVLDLILSRMPATLELTLAAVLGATFIGVPLGMYAGYRPNSPAAKARWACRSWASRCRPSGSG